MTQGSSELGNRQCLNRMHLAPSEGFYQIDGLMAVLGFCLGGGYDAELRSFGIEVLC